MSKPDEFYEDGFRHGGELPDDLDLDKMVYPEHKPKETMEMWPAGMSYDDWKEQQAKAEEERCERNDREDRQFTITEDNVTGRHTGPPRTVR